MAKNKLILIIDDEINIQLTLSHILTRAGFQVLTLTNNEESIKKVITKSIDLVIIDFDMKLNENECPLSMIRHKLMAVPLIILTHNPAAEITNCSHKFDHCELFIKPIDPEEILDVVTRMVEKTGIPKTQPNFITTN